MSGILLSEFINAFKKHFTEEEANKIMKDAIDKAGFLPKNEFTKAEGLELCSVLVLNEDRMVKTVALILKPRINMMYG